MFDDSEGEITPEIEQLMQKYESNKVALFFDAATLLDEYKRREESFKQMKKELNDKQNRVKKAITNLKNNILSGMQSLGEKSIKNDAHKITVAKGRPSVNVIKISDIPDDYKKATITINFKDLQLVNDFGIEILNEKIEPDKKAIIELYKNSEIEVSGTSIDKKPSLRIS